MSPDPFKTPQTFKKLLLLLSYLSLNFIGYFLIQTLNPHGTQLSTSLDSKIPLIPIFVIPYMLFIFYPIFSLSLFWNNYKNYLSLSLSLIIITSISLLIYYMFQTEVTHPTILPTTNLTYLISLIYYYDAPVNTFPSLHVAIPTLCTLFIHEKNKSLFPYILPITIFIILSTLFIKQHVILDVITSILIALIIFKYRTSFVSQTNNFIH
jgi:membrane-associated phospholipid phosphatase